MRRLRLTLTGLLWAIYLTLLAIMSLAVSEALAADKEISLSAEWSYETADEALILGYRIKDASGAIVVEVPDPAARAAEWTVMSDGKSCLPYNMVAYTADGDGPPSNIAMYCPKARPIKAVGTFEVQLQP